ncbi:MAG: nicotinate-nucleotide--dimethylbenzimidazole phosphoribosyltransferase [Alphaproteobacteria bacterium]
MDVIPAIGTLDEFRALIQTIPGPSLEAQKMTTEREGLLTKPPGSLGRLEELSAWLATWQHRSPPRMEKPACAVFAGNHGVAAQGVSAFPAEVTAQMVGNFAHGGAAINQLCRTFGVALTVEALRLDEPTADFTQAPAMEEAACVEAIRIGMRAAEKVVGEDCDVLCLGEMGIANTTSASAIGLALFGGEAVDWTGRGTGISAEVWSHKATVVRQAVEKHKAALTDGLEVLRCLGGRELAAIVGAVVAARLCRVPVMLDGFVCTAAAATLSPLRAGVLDHCSIAHVSAEPAHRWLSELLGKHPLLELNMRLGEASGAALAVGLLRGAVACHTGMATFAEAGVSDKETGRT